MCVYLLVWRNGAVRKMRFSVFVFVPCFFLVDVFFFFFCLCIGEREEFYKSLFVDCQKTSASAVFLLLLRL